MNITPLYADNNKKERSKGMILANCSEFERTLALHSAPALLGIKPACLMSLDRAQADIYNNAQFFNQKAVSRGLKIKILCECNSRCLMLLYSEKLLEKHLRNNECAALLEKYGYSRSMPLGQCLERLAERCAQGSDFPHEIGVFLGYPLEDVVGFIKNKGCGYKLCGYWKVYGDVNDASRIFKRYDKCRAFLCNRLNEGMNIYQALRIS